MVKFTYVITHPTNAVPNPPTIEDHREVPLEAYVDGKRNPERETLQNLLAGPTTDLWSVLFLFFYYFNVLTNVEIIKL